MEGLWDHAKRAKMKDKIDDDTYRDCLVQAYAKIHP